MQYSLGNMLKGGGALNPDGLALDLAFALDKTLTARKGPTPTFTRGSTGTFVGINGLIQSAAINVPRFDYDPATLASKGLLIEESRENRILRSEEFEHSNWVKTNISVSQDSIIAPNGLSTADLLQSVATSSSNVFASSVATATAVTYSIYTKKGNVATRFFLLRNSTTATNFQLGTINYDTATISGAGWTIQTLPNGWYRIAFTQSTGITLGDTLLAYCGMKGDIDTAGSTWSVWGAQVEAGAFPLSYIPTTSGTAARSADVCSITGTDFSSFYNQVEGTLFGDVTPQTVSQASAVLYVGDGGTQFQNGIYKSNSLLTAAGLRWGVTTVSTGFSTQASIVTATDVATSRSKLAYGFKLDDFGFAYEGTLVGTDSSGTLPAINPSQMGIGNRNGSIQINGHIARIQYFRKRLSNAKLQTLTAP